MGKEGNLAIMVGGNRQAIERVQLVLQKMGSSVTLTGAVGAGNVTKLANQIMVACKLLRWGSAGCWQPRQASIPRSSSIP